MTLRKGSKFAIAALVTVAVTLGILQYRSHVRCVSRSKTLQLLVDNLTDDAREHLRPGTAKDGVFEFFHDHHMQVDFGYGYASGSFLTTGCAPFGCGADTVIVGVSVKVDRSGAVTSEPQVSAMYDNCL